MASLAPSAPGKPLRFGSGGVVVVASGVILILLLALGGTFGWVGAWRLFGVPSIMPPFRDLDYLRVVADCAHSGVDVYTTSDCTNVVTKTAAGFRQQTFVYPPVWLLVWHLHWNAAGIPIIAAVIELAALGVFFLLVRGRSATWGAVAALALASPSILLGFERGNIDLVLFTLVGGASLLLARWTGPRLAAAFALIGTAVILKFHPMFCAVLAARRSRATLAFAGSLAALTAVYLACIPDVVRSISGALLADSVASYGHKVAFIAWDDLFKSLRVPFSPVAATSWPFFLAIAACLGAGAFALKASRRHGAGLVPAANAAGAGFLFGAGIYCGTFLSASNFSYRLVFLLLCLPQLFDWIDASGRGRALLGLVLLNLWLTAYPIALVMAHLAQWSLFTALVFVLAGNLMARSPPAATA